MESHKPLQWIFSFLKVICPSYLYEEIEGDLIQKFNRDVIAYGRRSASRRLAWNAVRFCRPGIILRNRFSLRLIQWDMFKHFVKVFFRTSFRNKTNTSINISGLVIGVTSFLLISIYVNHERSYDQFHSNKDQIFRVRHDRFTNGALTRQWSAGPMGIGSDLKNSFPEVIRYVRLNRGSFRNNSLANADVLFKEDKLFFATSDFFLLFSYPLIRGIDSLVLRDPFTMVISESLARRYFGDQDPVGKTLKHNGKDEYVVTGVFKDVPENTHLKFDALFSFESLLKILGPVETDDLMTNWGWEGTYTYIQLRNDADFQSLQAKIPAFVEKKMGNTLREWNEWMEFTFQPLTSIHSSSHTPDELEANGDEKSNQYLMLMAAFILAMAWINYVNLATAKSIERAAEIGIRKVLGSNRSQLIRQFVFESASMKIIALCISAGLIILFLPSFSRMTGRSIHLSIFRETTVWVSILAVFVLGVLGAGLYPAIVMSGFRPISILKGKFKASLKGNYLRKGLVTIQFITSVVLLVGVSVVYKQVQFIQNTPPGVDLEQVLVVKGPGFTDSAYRSHFHTFQQSLLQFPDIRKISVSTDVPGHSVTNSNGSVRITDQDLALGNAYRAIMTDEDFIETYGLTIKEGRNFSGNLHDEWKTVLVNETAMKLLGFTEPGKIIGKKIYLWDAEPEIIGVFKDYHQQSLKVKVDPLILVYDKGISEFFSIKINTRKPVSEIIKQAEAKYKEAFPGNPFSYYFVDDHYGEQYRSERLFEKVFGWFTAAAVLIACMGLFGLSSLLVVQRTKEIGIRKVLGATARQIAGLISGEFVMIVIIANVIAWPVAYWLMREWLGEFAYRIELNLLLFILPGLSALVIAIVTVSAQAIKAALINPVENLRSE